MGPTIYYEAIETENYRKKPPKMILRTASAYRTAAKEALLVIVGVFLHGSATNRNKGST